jgi:hypothetical protein
VFFPGSLDTRHRHDNKPVRCGPQAGRYPIKWVWRHGWWFTPVTSGLFPKQRLVFGITPRWWLAQDASHVLRGGPQRCQRFRVMPLVCGHGSPRFRAAASASLASSAFIASPMEYVPSATRLSPSALSADQCFFRQASLQCSFGGPPGVRRAGTGNPHTGHLPNVALAGMAGRLGFHPVLQGINRDKNPPATFHPGWAQSILPLFVKKRSANAEARGCFFN